MTPFKIIVKNIVKKIVGYSVCRTPFLNKIIYNGLTIFVFHEISDSPSDFCTNNKLSIPTKKFTKIVSWINENYKIISPKEIFDLESYPERSAVITFDDGFKGAFINGLNVLEKMGIPSLFFLNMRSVVEGVPMLSAVAFYLEENDQNFTLFCNDKNIKKPYHLTLTPDILKEFESNNGYIDYQSVLEYQGEFVDIELLRLKSKGQLVYYANHLYDHWNVHALTDNQLIEQYSLNKKELIVFDNYIDCFAFTNGEPNTAYCKKNISILNKLFPKKIFSTLPVVNRSKERYILHRVSLLSEDVDYRYIYYKMFRGHFNRLYKYKNVDI